LQKIAIIVPVHNEEEVLGPFFKRVLAVVASQPIFRWQLIFVNDGSTDNSLTHLLALNSTHSGLGITVIDLSRNFGKEAALSAGLASAEVFDAVICIDADLQHPPELIPSLIAEWQSGAEMVVTIRTASKKESWWRMVSSRLYYWLINQISSVHITPKSTDFRLFDRKVVKEFLKITERERMFRGIMDWMGYKRAYVNFIASEREIGTPSYSFYSLVRLAVNSITSFSLWPLRITGYLGVFITSVSGILLFWMLISYFMRSQVVYTPLAVVVVANTFLIGVVLTGIGLVALYIGSIHTEVINRPLYIIRDIVESN
jgi:dolichol-phosphate mannosyltransferase